MQSRFLFPCVALFWGACATTPPPLSNEHPASPEAAVGKEKIAVRELQPDADTLRTTQLLKERSRQAKQATDAPDEPSAAVPTPTPTGNPTPAPMPGMDHMNMPMGQ